MANRVMLSGMLLQAKGDRSVRNASMEGRYPFLDERVVDFCLTLPPEYKLRGWTDKWLLRQVAARVLPQQIAGRPKTMFRANLASTFLGDDRPPWIDELLSPASLQKTGLFEPDRSRVGASAGARKVAPLFAPFRNGDGTDGSGRHAAVATIPTAVAAWPICQFGTAPQVSASVTDSTSAE